MAESKLKVALPVRKTIKTPNLSMNAQKIYKESLPSKAALDQDPLEETVTEFSGIIEQAFGRKTVTSVENCSLPEWK